MYCVYFRVRTTLNYTAYVVSLIIDTEGLGIVATGISNNIGTTRNGTTYSSSTSSGATESLSIGNNINGNALVAISGAPTAGDILTVTISNAALSGGSESVNYTVLSTDSTVSIAAGLTSLINASLDLQTIGLSASNSASGDFDWTQRFSAKPTLANGNNDAIAAATDGASNVAESSYQVNTTASSSASLTFDYNGNMTSDGVNSYDWDAENRLVKITYLGTDNFSTFVYDGLSRNVSITETVASSITSTKQFVWSIDARNEERDGSGIVTKKFFGRGQMNSTTKYFFTLDQLNSVREMTDNSGVCQAQYVFDPFGNETKIQGSSDSEIRYAGYYVHTRSALPLALYRAYYCKFGRWLSRDPLEEEAGTNLFDFVGNNPVNKVDLLGLDMGGFSGVGASVSAGAGTQTQSRKRGRHAGNSDSDGDTGAGPGGPSDKNPRGKRCKRKCEPPAPGQDLEVKTLDQCYWWCLHNCPPQQREFCKRICRFEYPTDDEGNHFLPEKMGGPPPKGTGGTSSPRSAE